MLKESQNKIYDGCFISILSSFGGLIREEQCEEKDVCIYARGARQRQSHHNNYTTARIQAGKN